MSDSTFEHNLRLLLSRAWRPSPPRAGFEAQLVQRLEARAQELYGRSEASRAGQSSPTREPRRRLLTRVALAAGLLAALLLGLRLLDTGGAPPESQPGAGPEALLASGRGALERPLDSGRWSALSTASPLTLVEVPQRVALPEALSLDLCTAGGAHLGQLRGPAEVELGLDSRGPWLRLARGQAWDATGRPLEPGPQLQRLGPDSGGPVEAPAMPGSGRTAVAVGPSGTEPEPTNGSDEADPEVAQLAALALAVTGPGGEPLSAYRVGLRQQVDLPLVAEPAFREARQDGTGPWSWADLEPGRYALGLEAPGLAPGLWADLRLEAGATLALELTLEPGRRLAGYVLEEATGAPVQGALVLVEDRLPHQVLLASGAQLEPTPLASARTDAAGRFLLEAAPQGTHRLRVLAEGLASQRLLVPAAQPGPPDPEAVTELAPLSLEAGAEVFGHVQRRDGSPWSGAAVIASQTDNQGDTEVMLFGYAESDSLGDFRMIGLPEGSYVLLLPEELAMEGAPGPGAGGLPRIHHARLRRGAPQEVHFVGAQEDGPAGVHVRGRVRLADGSPAAQARLTLMPRSSGRWSATTADDQGRVAFTGVPPGEYLLVLGLGSGFRSLAFLQVLHVGSQAPEPFELRAGPHRLGGHQPGMTGGYAFLEVEGATGWRPLGMGLLDREGRWELPGLPAGRVRGAVFGRDASEGFAWLEPVALKDPEGASAPTQELSGERLASGSLKLTVQGPDGQPAAGVKVALVTPLGRPLMFEQDTETDSSGRVTVPVLPAGTWRLELTPPGREPQLHQTFIQAGSPLELTLTLRHDD